MNADQLSLLSTAVQSFQRACANESPLLNAIYGVRAVILACNCPERPAAAEEIVTLIDDLIYQAAPRIAQAAGPSIEGEAVWLGLGATGSLLREVLLRPEADDLTQACLDHAALLACEMDALYRRREIERRGDCLRKYILSRRFEALTPYGQSLQ